MRNEMKSGVPGFNLKSLTDSIRSIVLLLLCLHYLGKRSGSYHEVQVSIQYMFGHTFKMNHICGNTQTQIVHCVWTETQIVHCGWTIKLKLFNVGGLSNSNCSLWVEYF